MTTTTHTCDRCGKEVRTRDVLYSVMACSVTIDEQDRNDTASPERITTDKGFEICLNCITTIMRDIQKPLPQLAREERK